MSEFDELNAYLRLIGGLSFGRSKTRRILRIRNHNAIDLDDDGTIRRWYPIGRDVGCALDRALKSLGLHDAATGSELARWVRNE